MKEFSEKEFFRKDIINVHDKFFKQTFSNKKFVIDFFNNYLPQHIKTLIDFNNIEVFKDSFIDKDLKQHFSDLLYKVKIKNKTAFIYFLFEHKSFPDKFVSFQLIKYMIKIWDLLFKQNKIKDKLPLIIPIVFYHGVNKWNIDIKFSSLFDIEEKLMYNYIPEFNYILYDLSSISDEDIKGNILLRISLTIFKYIFRKELPEKLNYIIDLLNELLKKESGLDYIETIFRYILLGNEYIKEEDIKIVEKKLEGGGFSVPTLAEKWYSQGVEKGIEKGIIDGLKEGIKLSLELKFKEKAKDLYKDIEKIEDINLLKEIMSLIKTAKDIDNIKNFIINK